MDHEAGQVWSDPDAPAICLLAIGIDRNPEVDGKHLLCLNWIPRTWADEILHETGSPPHPRALHRLGAALGLMNNPDEFYHSVPGFSHVCEGLAADWFDSSTDHPITTDEIARGLIEAHLIHPPGEGEAFAPSVVRYVNWVIRNDGFSKLPELIKAFGIPTDPEFNWGHDISGDPDLSAIATEGDKDRQEELVNSISDYLLELSDRLEALPLRNLNAKAVAQDIRSRVPGLPKR